MYEHIEKPKENKDRVVAYAVGQKKSNGKQGFGIMDNRPETVQMQKLHEMINNSPQAKQAIQLQASVNYHPTQQHQPIQKKENKTGLPGHLKSGIETLSGYSMDEVRVHRHSDKPAQLNAHAYTQGTDIHIASGQEKHLPHEAWHFVQQQQRRVQSTIQRKDGVNLNENAGLEKEADVIGAKVMQRGQMVIPNLLMNPGSENLVYKNLSTTLPVAQLTKFFSHAHRDEADHREPASPFQLATVQFSGEYDIKVYREEIKEYAARCKEEEKIPVIELRMYDAATPENIDEYLMIARSLLEPVITDQIFDVSCSILRDETQAPEEIPELETSGIMETVIAFREWLSSARDVDMDTDPESREKFGRTGERRGALDHPVGKMLAGRMMIPLEEAIHFTTLDPSSLRAIYAGTSEERYSLHQRLLAKVLLQSEARPRVPTGGRLRRNSVIRPDSLTITNLVTGDETTTLHSTIAACHAAFHKGTKQLYLIIEARGEDGSRRAAKQIDALRREHFVVELMQSIIGESGVQQSGVMLDEPGTIPERIKLKVRIPTEEADFELAEQGHHPLNQWLRNDLWEAVVSEWSYEKWYQKQVGANLDEANEFESIYFPQYQDHLCKNWPSLVVHIRDMNPVFFMRTYPMYQELYIRQLASNMNNSSRDIMEHLWGTLGADQSAVRDVILGSQEEFPHAFLFINERS